MLSVTDLSEFEPRDEEEIKALELEWNEGQLAGHVERLLAFVAQQRPEILLLAEGRKDADVLQTATKRWIVRTGTVHPKSELLDQITEMQRELWYCGERGEHDHARIKLEWTSRHASNWRRWRIKEYLFVADRCAARIVGRLGVG